MHATRARREHGCSSPSCPRATPEKSWPCRAGLETASWRARLVTGESLKVPQVLPGGDPPLQPFGAPELPLLPPPPDGSFQPLTRPPDQPGWRARPASLALGAPLAHPCLGAPIAWSLAQSSTLPALSQGSRGTSATSFRCRPVPGLYFLAARVGEPDPRIKSLSGASSPGFMRVRAAAQIACAYSSELCRTGVNCNPNCNLWGLLTNLVQARKLTIQRGQRSALISQRCRSSTDDRDPFRDAADVDRPARGVGGGRDR